MNEIDFLGYRETPAEKYLGIATVRVARLIILKYRINKTKDGLNLFPAAPSYKELIDGEEKWQEWHLIDSRMLNDEVISVIKSKVKLYYSQKPAETDPFASAPNDVPPENPWGPSDPSYDQPPPMYSQPKPPQQPNPNYQPNAQQPPAGWGHPTPPPQQNQFSF